MLPPDLDDTSCVSAVLARNGANGAADRRILLANRNRRGLFYTWIVPRLRWTSAPHRQIMASQLRLIPALIAFFRSTSASPGDIDAVVNANCLYALGSFGGAQGGIPSSIVAPSLLLEEVEIRGFHGEPRRLPLVPAPPLK